MKDGFIKVAAVTPKIVVADTKENTRIICDAIKNAGKQGAKVIVLPELCITGYTCSDLFLQEKMLREAKEAGCKTGNGMYMLLYQGAASFKLWTGEDMPVEIIKEKYFSGK